MRLNPKSYSRVIQGEENKWENELGKWKGYSDDFNSWIPMKDLNAL